MEPSEELAAALARHGDLLMNELERLAELPQARLLPGSVFDTAEPPGSVPQLRGVQVRLRCCKKPCNVKCNGLEGEKACHSHVDAAQALRAKILRDHSSPMCLEKAQLALTEEKAEAAVGSSTGAPAVQTIAQLMANQLAIQRAHSELKAAQRQLDDSIEAERAASELRVAASSALEEVGSCRWTTRPCARSPCLSAHLSAHRFPIRCAHCV
jgi:hypothetical protein